MESGLRVQLLAALCAEKTLNTAGGGKHEGVEIAALCCGNGSALGWDIRGI